MSTEIKELNNKNKQSEDKIKELHTKINSLQLDIKELQSKTLNINKKEKNEEIIKVNMHIDIDHFNL